jgi:predicted GTPase
MSRWRVVLVVVLIVAPFLFLAGAGSYHLWTEGYGWYVWGFMVVCMGLGYGLGWYWQHKRQLLRPVEVPPPGHWTARDQEAWRLVEARAQAAAKLDRSKFSEAEYYLATAKEMALELARFYHPGVQDPTDSLTIPEILTVVELAAQDLAEMVDEYLPGGHLLTLRDWRRARQISDWYQSASNAYYLISAIFAPISTGLRYTASRVGLSTPWRQLQENLLLWFYTAYIQRLGTYLIELNSGRLRVGARRYRELLRESDGEGEKEAGPRAAEQIETVTVTILGQVKAGKSSFVNALLGEQLARTDILPATDQVTRYQLQPPGIPARLVLLDTVGYAHEGPRADQVRVTRDTSRQSDLIVLVLHARNPARQADLEMLKNLRDWFTAQPDLKMPPVVAVLTHTDLLSPSLEWAPPYDWQKPQRPKEQQIAQAVQAVKDALGTHLAGVIPVCTAPGKMFGIQEWFMPALSALLDEVHAVALLRCLRGEIDTGKVRKVFHQMLQAGKQVVRVLWENRPP